MRHFWKCSQMKKECKRMTSWNGDVGMSTSNAEKTKLLKVFVKDIPGFTISILIPTEIEICIECFSSNV